jgi:hypothetical protein
MGKVKSMAGFEKFWVERGGAGRGDTDFGRRYRGPRRRCPGCALARRPPERPRPARQTLPLTLGLWGARAGAPPRSTHGRRALPGHVGDAPHPAEHAGAVLFVLGPKIKEPERKNTRARAYIPRFVNAKKPTIGRIFVKKSIISQIRGPNGPGIYQGDVRGGRKVEIIATPRSAYFFYFQSSRKNAVAIPCTLVPSYLAVFVSRFY